MKQTKFRIHEAIISGKQAIIDALAPTFDEKAERLVTKAKVGRATEKLDLNFRKSPSSLKLKLRKSFHLKIRVR